MTNPNSKPPGPPPDERRCIYIIRRTGKRCTNWALKGTTICRKHGVNKATRAAASRAVVQQEAQERASKMVAKLSAADGVEPERYMVRTLTECGALMEYWKDLCAGLDESAREGLRGQLHYSESKDPLDALAVKTSEPMLGLNRHGEAQIHPFVEQYNASLDRLMKAWKLCLDAGIAERRVRLAENQGREMVRKIQAFCVELEAKLGTAFMREPWFPGMIRRYLLGEDDSIDGTVVD